MGWVRELGSAGPDLDGYRVGFQVFSKGSNAKHGFAGSWYLEGKESREQEVLEVGVDISYPYVRFSRVGFGPRLRVALVERAEPPHRGTDGAVGLGFEFGVWLSDTFQITAIADRIVDFEAGARTTYSLNLRVLLWTE